MRMEADDTYADNETPTPTPSPNQPAKMPTGEEPWWKMKEGKEKDDDESSMVLDT